MSRSFEDVGVELQRARMDLSVHSISIVRGASRGCGILSRESLVTFRYLEADVDRLETEWLSMVIPGYKPQACA